MSCVGVQLKVGVLGQHMEGLLPAGLPQCNLGGVWRVGGRCDSDVGTGVLRFSWPPRAPSQGWGCREATLTRGPEEGQPACFLQGKAHLDL